jgi:hypothetical protein
VVEVADRQVSAMTYVGHGIRASVAQMPVRWSNPSHREFPSEASTPARRRRAPCTDKY